MTAGPFLVTLPAETTSKVLFEGVDSVVVYAHDDDDASAMAQALYSGDGEDAQWGDSANVTAIAAAADFTGWRLRVQVTATQHGVASPFDVTVVGVAGNAVSDIAALMVTALNATHINGAGFSGSTLKIAETTDGVGDSTVYVYFYPPAANVQHDVSISDFISNLVDAGVAADALTVDLNTTYIAPSVVGYRLHK